MVAPGDRRNIVAYLQGTFQVSVTRACQTTGLAKSVYYYRSCKDDSMVIDKLSELSQSKPMRGFPYYYGRIRNEGLIWNHKRVKRVYDNMKLNLRRKRKRRLASRSKEALCQPATHNHTWSMDFMHDTLTNGRKVRILNIIDDYNREALMVHPDYSHSGYSVMRAIEQIMSWRGKPATIRCDNGPEFLSNVLVNFCTQHNISLKYIQPGKPTQNAYIERFNRSYREDILNAYYFDNLRELEELSYIWMKDYNELHPHQSLDNMSPLKYLEMNQ